MGGPGGFRDAPQKRVSIHSSRESVRPLCLFAENLSLFATGEKSMTPVRIGLVIGTDSEYGRRVLRGISKFARETGRRWLFSLTPHREPDLRSLAAWQPAGIIAHLLTRRQAYQVMALGKPVVNVAFLFKDPELPHVGNDDVGI